MKDIIKIYDNKEKVREVEVVTVFQLDEFDYKYIICRENKTYFVAKYKGSGVVFLNTSFSGHELQLCTLVFLRYKKKRTLNVIKTYEMADMHKLKNPLKVVLTNIEIPVMLFPYSGSKT